MPGTIRRGDTMRLASRPDHGITVPDTFRAFMGDLDEAERVLAAGCLVENEAAELRDMLKRRRPAGSELNT